MSADPIISLRRRTLLLGLLGATSARATAAISNVSGPLAPWQRGGLDIHHIATGQGNATLTILPDGTSLLIDAGATASSGEYTAPPRPGSQMRNGEWIGRYVRRHLDAAGFDHLDYFLATHTHPDHIGAVSPATPLSADGSHRLTGVPDVAALVPIDVVVDRGFPDYAYPIVEKADFAENYRAFVRSRVRAGQKVERFIAGSATQFAPVGRLSTAGEFGIRNISANGVVWTGRDEITRTLFPPLEALRIHDFPTENMCSTAIRIDSGRFSYFTAGDLTSDTRFGQMPWRDALSPAATAAGTVDVATADHHGLFDSLTVAVARALQPQAWVVQAWHASHPSIAQLEIMLSEHAYPGARSVFATNIAHANQLANGRLLRQLRSVEGHVIVRVAPGGKTFDLVVTSNADESDTVKLVTRDLPSRSRP